MATQDASDTRGDRLARIGALLRAHADVLAGRADGAEPPAWCEARGWREHLEALDDDRLRRAESDPAEVLCDDAPADLRELARRVRELTALPSLAAETGERMRGASPSKRAQVAGLRALLSRELAGDSARLVDFGAGRGHLTRALADALDLPALGVERRPDVVARARALTEADDVRFTACDARDVTPRRTDVLVGLHACGGLGDAVVNAAAESGAAMVLVPCCPQKIEADVREPLSEAGRAAALEIDRRTLGLANMGALGEGPVLREDALERRRKRLALRMLLADSGHAVAIGEESRGINRKRFRGPLLGLAERAFTKRGLPVPTEAVVEEADARSRAAQAASRRWSLPRALLARPLELALALDRAARLEERGREVRVLEAFARSVSPRNLVIVAPRAGGAGISVP